MRGKSYLWSTCLITALLGGSITSASHVAAQDYPTRPIRLVVPFPAGGGVDLVARVLAKSVIDQTGWNIVVDNRQGVGGALGVEIVARSAPDGYTMVLGQTSNLALAPALLPKLGYDPQKDLQPVSLVSSGPLILITPKGSRFKSMADVIAIAKAEPGKVLIGSPGNGTLGHLAGELIKQTVGIQLEHVPYRGAAQGVLDVLGGRLELFIPTVPAALTHIRSGRLQAIATLSRQRHADLPDTPSIAEAALGDLEAINWSGVLVPAGTPKPAVAALSRAVSRALTNPEVRSKFAAEGVSPQASSPQEFAALIGQEIARWGKVVKASGIKMQ